MNCATASRCALAQLEELNGCEAVIEYHDELQQLTPELPGVLAFTIR